jgi:hypothetical protein
LGNSLTKERFFSSVLGINGLQWLRRRCLSL